MENEDFAALELRTMRSAWRSLGERWGLTPQEVRALLPAGGEEDAAPPRDTETRMRIMIEIGYRIGLPRDLLHEWLRTATPTLGWLAPIDAMSGTLGDLRGIRRLIDIGFAS